MSETFRTIIAYILIIPQIVLPVFLGNIIPMKNARFEKWNENKTFTRDYAFEVEKTPGKDFVILNLTDIQLSKNQMRGEYGEMAKAIIDSLVAETKPDLITVTGDNGGDCYTYITLGQWLDSYDIPWSLVMGNHDGESGKPNEAWCARSLLTSKNCLFKMGPKDMGYGNYIINITENDKIIHTLFMMDTHSGAEAGGINATEDKAGYDHLWQPQLDWYKWAVNGIADINGSVVESTVFMHIPVYQYRLAWASHYDTKNSCFKPEYQNTDFGVNHEWVCSPEADNGFFDLCKELGSTKNMVAGHDHVNCSSILYEGIRLSYGVKCGAGCYWEPEMSGGTTITISSDGSAKVEHHFIDASQYLK